MSAAYAVYAWHATLWLVIKTRQIRQTRPDRPGTPDQTGKKDQTSWSYRPERPDKTEHQKNPYWFGMTCHAVQGPTTALSEPYLNDITTFDVNSHTWHTPEVHGARPPVRDSHAAVALGDRMVIYGGDCGKEYLGDVWAYHVEHQRWQAFKVASLCPEAGAYTPCT